MIKNIVLYIFGMSVFNVLAVERMNDISNPETFLPNPYVNTSIHSNILQALKLKFITEDSSPTIEYTHLDNTKPHSIKPIHYVWVTLSWANQQERGLATVVLGKLPSVSSYLTEKEVRSVLAGSDENGIPKRLVVELKFLLAM